MREEVSAVNEEYLEGVYRLQEKNGIAKTSEMVKLLQVTPGTVTNTVERLEMKGWITHKPYKGVKLTDEGRKIALRVIRRHRLSERLLTDILQVDWDKVHEPACRLEHAITDNVDKKLEEVLNHPKTCPHGNPIPTMNGSIDEDESASFSNLDLEENGTIVRITEEKPEVLRYLASLNLMPGKSVKINEKIPFIGLNITTEKGNSVVLSHDIALIIRVRRV